MKQIQIDYEGETVSFNLGNFEEFISALVRMGKDFVEWVMELIHEARITRDPLVAAA